MKTILKGIVGRTAQNPIVWPVYRACGSLSTYLGKVHGHASYARMLSERDQALVQIAGELFPALTVAHGPFRGLRFPQATSVGSMLLPKLVGSYESELHGWLEKISVGEYCTIVNIGCAEGYYAVGMGMKCPGAEIYAFDIDAKARELCSEMAKINGVGARIHVGGLCDQSLLKTIPLGRRALVLADCEGYERTLFTAEMAHHLAAHDVIIETHDFIDIDISTRMREVFSATHGIESVKSRDDIEKAHTYKYPELDRYDTAMRRMILAERRPAIMEWLIMTPKGSVA